MAGVMKDSEVEWIGEIPEGWDISKVKYIGRYINGYAFKPDQWGQDGLPIIRIQNLSGSSESINYFDGKISDDYLIDDGDILISWSATLDAFIWNYGKGWLNQHIFKAIPNVQKTHKSYFFHLMKIAMLNMSSDKHGSAMQHVTNQIFGNFQVPLPSLSEQKLIADFLDEKCAEIDNLSEDIQKQIDILNDYKKSVITRAVTKGLDPNAEMKDSGIKWIGEIPKDWTCKKIKYLANTKQSNSFVDGDWIEAPFVKDNGIRYITTGNIGDGVFKRQGDGYVTEEDFKMLKCKYAYSGDLIFSRLNEEYGRSCILPNDYPKYVIAVDNVILRTEHDKRFICYCTQCPGYHDSVADYARGTAMKRISRINLGNISIPIPTLSEEVEIADYLDDKCSKINDSISAKQEQIAKLDTYKKSMIYEYVTGKKRMKGLL